VSTTTLTPLRRQYLDIKRQHPESLLFFRLGDFYELFDRDAEVAAEELQIVLTFREFGRSGRSPMCGVPHHAVAGYIARLVEAGHRVAVCDQVTAAGNGLVDRAVTRVITPGTVVDEDMLRPQANNYLAAVVPADNLVGFAYADVTTGEFAATEARHDQLGPELSRVSPRETLAFGDVDLPGAVTGADWMADPGTAEEALRRHFAVQDLDGLGLADRPQASRAAGALLAYVTETDANALHVLAGLHVYSVSTYMELDPATRSNLEPESGGRASRRDHSVLGVLDHTRTPMGARRLRRHAGHPLQRFPVRDGARRRACDCRRLHPPPRRRRESRHRLGHPLRQLLGGTVLHRARLRPHRLHRPLRVDRPRARPGRGAAPEPGQPHPRQHSARPAAPRDPRPRRPGRHRPRHRAAAAFVILRARLTRVY